MIFKKIFSNSISLFMLIVFTGLFLQACEDNPASTETSDHAAAIGYQLEIDGDILLRYFQRQYTIDPDGNFEDFTDGNTIVFHEGNLTDGISDLITIRWIDENQNVFNLAEFGEEAGGDSGQPGDYNLEFDILIPGDRNNQIPADERPVAVDYDMFESTWTFRLQALQSGETDFRIRLFHLDHDDLVPVPFQLRVDLD